MPVARIVTRRPADVSALADQLRAAGYRVEIVSPEQVPATPADLDVDVTTFPRDELLPVLMQLNGGDTDVLIAPGVLRYEAEAPAEAVTPQAEAPRADGVLDETLDDVSVAFSDARPGVRESLAASRERVSSAWNAIQQRLAAAAETRRQEQERRLHEQEAQRQLREQQRLEAERQQREQERLRELRRQEEERERREQEQRVREAMAREAAFAAERARAEEEARRQGALAARARAEEETRRQAALQAERMRVAEEARRRAAPIAPPVPAQLRPPHPAVQHAPMASASRVAYRDPARPTAMYPPRRVPSPRDRQWQRAAFFASVAALALMLGFALGLNLKPSSPLPGALPGDAAQQQVPFGPASIAPPATVAPHASPANAPGKPEAAPAAPSHKPTPARRVHRAGYNSESDVVAEDEVVVRHYPAGSQKRTAQSRDSVRRFSDQD